MTYDEKKLEVFMIRFIIRPIIVLVTMTCVLSAQQQQFSPGIKAGFNLATLQGDDLSKERTWFGGLTGGFFFRLNFSKFIGLQPELLYEQKGMKIEINDYTYKTRLHYLEMPVQVMLSAPWGKLMIPYVSAGPYAGVLIEARNRVYNDLDEISRDITTDLFSRADFGVSAGFGSSFNLDAGDVVLDFRFNIGLIDIADENKHPDASNFSFAMTFGYVFKIPALIGHRAENVQKADAAYFRFTGNIKGVTIEVDGGPRFEITSSEISYETSPGKHEIRAYRDSQLILHRQVYIGNHETMEVAIK